MFVLMAVVAGILGNFLREAAVRILDALGAVWGMWENKACSGNAAS